jgi:hypothetical protein
MTVGLKGFFGYYGSKRRIVHRYPYPKFDIVIEPFAGSASYAVNYFYKKVILADKYKVIANIWDFLISNPSAATEIRRTKFDINHISELAPDTPPPVIDLIGFHLNWATAHPVKSLSVGEKRHRAKGRTYVGWCRKARHQVSEQVPFIKHWSAFQGEYYETSNPQQPCTIFLDPPYLGCRDAGAHYDHGSDNIDYDHLASWCLELSEKGHQVIVCESEGHGGWLPFKKLIWARGNYSRDYLEYIWTNDEKFMERLEA